MHSRLSHAVWSSHTARSAAARPKGAVSWYRCASTLLTAGLVVTAALSACAPGEVSGANAFPSGIPDPSTVQTPDGALAFYHHTVADVGTWFDPLAVETGVLTDELANLPLPQFHATLYTALDSRTTLGGTAYYNALHNLRAQAREARGFLATYPPIVAPDSAPPYSVAALRGHLYALEGYAEVFLADLFCSGIPLSTVEYQGDYTLAPGSSTREVYTHAVALFDTALTLFADSAQLAPLAAVGRARALLALGEYAEAAAAVAAVPDGYQYPVTFSSTTQGEVLQAIAQGAGIENILGNGPPSVGDREGAAGLPYLSSADPRVRTAAVRQDKYGNTLYLPTKYPLDGTVTFLLADGIEARLIEAEAALQANADDGQWLLKLNALRTDGTYELLESGDTLWHRGTGGVDSLPPLADPGSADSQARVDLLFRERAFWLYLTGHRQGDLRRLVRQYHRLKETVFPNGTYPGGAGQYGPDVVFSVPASERRLNPKYTGCISLAP